jgi:hypothetical protein
MYVFWNEASSSSTKEEFILNNIQNVPGGKVNILLGHSVSHCKWNRVHLHVSYSERFRDRAILLCSSEIVDKKEILRTVSNTGIYCSSDKVGTVYLV